MHFRHFVFVLKSKKQKTGLHMHKNKNVNPVKISCAIWISFINPARVLVMEAIFIFVTVAVVVVFVYLAIFHSIHLCEGYIWNSNEKKKKIFNKCGQRIPINGKIIFAFDHVLIEKHSIVIFFSTHILISMASL